MLRYLITFLILSACFALFFKTGWVRHWSRRVRRRGSPRAQPTLFDVRQLLQEGERARAVTLTMEIFGVGRREAEQQIAQLERSLRT